MADKEIVIPFDKIQDSQTITTVQERIFKEKGLDMHKNEVNELIDDHSSKKRILKVKNVKYFFMGGK